MNNILDNIKSKLDELNLGDKLDTVMSIIQDNTRPVIDIAEGKLETMVLELNPNTINVVNIPTGRMPRTIAEKYIKDVASLFKSAYTAHIKDDEIAPQFIYTPKPSNSDGLIINELHKDTAYILQVDVGLMPKAKADAYIEQHRILIEEPLKEQGYNIKIMGYSNMVKNTLIIEE